jgi:hypothetical protein
MSVKSSRILQTFGLSCTNLCDTPHDHCKLTHLFRTMTKVKTTQVVGTGVRGVEASS